MAFFRNTSWKLYSAQAYELADAVELLCLSSLDGVYSVSDLVDALKMERGATTEQHGESEEQEHEQIVHEADDPGEESSGLDENADSLDRQARDTYLALRARTATFGNRYPFALDEAGDTLKLKTSSSADYQLYLFFLLCSSLERIEKSPATTLAFRFEVICAIAVRSFLPPPWEVEVFGTTSGSANSAYSGNLWSKIQKLATTLRDPVDAPVEEFDSRNTGDEGLDIVAYRRFSDSARGCFVALGQCACGDRWTDKQLTVLQDRWSKIIRFAQPTLPFACIPYSFRKIDGQWFKEHKVSTVLLDRVRLLELLTDRTLSALDTKANDLVETAKLREQESAGI